MFADLMDKEIQPKSIDVRHLPEIEISDSLKNEIQEMLETEENNYARVFGRTAVVQIDRNYVFFPNQWLYLAVLCKKYAEALKPYGDFFDKEIRGKKDRLKIFSSGNYESPQLQELIPDATDRERMIKFVNGNSPFRPGKSLINKENARSTKDIFSSCVLKKIAVPDTSATYLGNLIYYLSKRPELYRAIGTEVLQQVGDTGNPSKLPSVTKDCAKVIVDSIMDTSHTGGRLPDAFASSFSRRYITSLLAKPFVILTGNSGTGKTRISKQFAEYLEVIDANGEKNWLIVPVGADWTDNTRVLGFYNPLADNGVGKYEKTGILKLMERANDHPEIPYFLILDEMNLSQVERYFSDFLSHMETPDNPFEPDGYKGKDGEDAAGKLSYPGNLFVTGTVNIDETTYMFSPKVLDRANVVEFRPEKEDVLKLFHSAGREIKITPAKPGVAEAFLRLAREIRNGKSELDERQTAEVCNVFTAIYEIVEKNGYEFAYRTVKEIRQYLSAACALSGQWDDVGMYRAIDEQLLQKVLPKIHGNRKEIGTILDELEAICKQNGKELELSGKKIEQMKGKLAAVQYASFI